MENDSLVNSSNEDNDSSDSKNVICKNCGEQLSENTKFCPNCGTKNTSQELEVKKISFVVNVGQK